MHLNTPVYAAYTPLFRWTGMQTEFEFFSSFLVHDGRLSLATLPTLPTIHLLSQGTE